MKALHTLTDEELQKDITECLSVAYSEGGSFPYNAWFKRMNADLAMVYQNEQNQRQTERTIRVLEELTDVVRRKKLTKPQ